jgi:hypothetical protein
MGEGRGESIDWAAVFDGLATNEEHASSAAAATVGPSSAMRTTGVDQHMWDNMFPPAFPSRGSFSTANTPREGRPKPVHRSTFPYSAPISPVQQSQQPQQPQDQNEMFRQLAHSMFGPQQNGGAGVPGASAQNGQMQLNNGGARGFGNLSLPYEGTSIAHRELEARLKGGKVEGECLAVAV